MQERRLCVPFYRREAIPGGVVTYQNSCLGNGQQCDDGQHFIVKIRRKLTFSKLAFCLAIFYNMQYAIPIDEQFG